MFDLDSAPRYQDATGKGYPIIDMGAYEYSGSTRNADTNLVLNASSYYLAAGGAVTLTVDNNPITPLPGSITFVEDGNPLSAVMLNGGQAAFTTPALTPGYHKFWGTYPGQGSFSPATTQFLWVSVDRYSSALSLSSSLNPSAFGQSVTFTVKASATDGTVPSPITLTDSNSTLATLMPNSSGVATFTTSTLAVGYHAIQAVYAGDTVRSGSSAYLTQQVVNPYATTTAVISAPNPSIVNGAVALTATVTSSGGGVPTGTISFTYGSTSLGSGTVSATNANAGTASISTSTLPVGYDTVTATFVPTGSFAASSGYTVQQVLSGYPSNTTLTSSLNPSSVNQSVTFTATVAAQNSANGTPAGSVSFSDGATVLGSQPLTSGKAALATSALARGPHTITATYVPAGSFAGSSNVLTQTVNGQPAAATLTASPSSVTYGSPVTLTATVTSTAAGTPTGTITFYDGGAILSTQALSNATASLQLASPAGGPHSYTCTYSGDNTFNSASCAPVAYTVGAAASALTLTSSANPSPALASITFTASLITNGSAVASAPIAISIDGTSYASVITNAAGVVNIPAHLGAGTHTVSASYAGDASHLPSTASVTETVITNPTTTALTASPDPAVQNQTITLAVTIQATTGTAQPYGLVTINDAGMQIYKAVVAPGPTPAVTVTFQTSTLGVGTHTLTATYSNTDPNFISSTSAPVTLVVTPADAVLTTDSNTLSIQTEHHGDIGLSIASVGGLTGTFNLACGPMPAWANCYFGSSTLTLPANGKATTTLDIDTDAVRDFKSSLAAPGKPGQPSSKLPLLALAPLALLAFGGRRRNASALRDILRCSAALFLFIVLAGSLTGCGDKYPSHTEPGSYTVQVTATAVPGTTPIPMTRTATFTLQVTQ